MCAVLLPPGDNPIAVNKYIYQVHIDRHLKYPLFLSECDETSNFIDGFSGSTQITHFMKIHPVGTEFFHDDGRTGMAKLMVALRNFLNAPNKCST